MASCFRLCTASREPFGDSDIPEQVQVWLNALLAKDWVLLLLLSDTPTPSCIELAIVSRNGASSPPDGTNSMTTPVVARPSGYAAHAPTIDDKDAAVHKGVDAPVEEVAENSIPRSVEGGPGQLGFGLRKLLTNTLETGPKQQKLVLVPSEETTLATTSVFQTKVGKLLLGSPRCVYPLIAIIASLLFLTFADPFQVEQTGFNGRGTLKRPQRPLLFALNFFVGLGGWVMLHGANRAILWRTVLSFDPFLIYANLLRMCFARSINQHHIAGDGRTWPDDIGFTLLVAFGGLFIFSIDAFQASHKLRAIIIAVAVIFCAVCWLLASIAPDFDHWIENDKSIWLWGVKLKPLDHFLAGAFSVTLYTGKAFWKICLQKLDFAFQTVPLRVADELRLSFFEVASEHGEGPRGVAHDGKEAAAKDKE